MNRTGVRAIAAAVALSVAALGLAACGSSSDNAAGGKNEIAIGVIGQFTGTFASSYGGIPKALDAWEKSVNATGGIDGRRVHLVSKDVGSTTGANVAAARSLIQQSKVTAIVSFDQSDVTWVKYASASSVPVVSGLATPAALVSPNVFSVGVNSVAAAYAVITEAKKAGGSFAIGYPAELATAAQIVALAKSFGKAVGVKVAVAAKLSSTLPDYSAFCQQLKSSKVNSYLLGVSATVAKKISDQCHQQGVRTPQILLGPNVTPSWRDDPAFSGSRVVDGVAPFFDTSVPGVAAYRKALRTYEPTFIGSPTDTSIPAFAWTSAKLVEKGLRSLRGDVTPKGLQSALFAVRGETLSGLTSPLTFARGHTTSINCWFTWAIKDGKYSSAAGTTPSCAPSKIIDPVLAQAAQGLRS